MSALIFNTLYQMELFTPVYLQFAKEPLDYNINNQLDATITVY